MEMQDRVAATSWPDGVSVRIRLGIHTGEPALAAEGYVGMDVHAAARVSSAAHGGQIVASDAARDAIDAAHPGLTFVDLGTYRLKGVPDPHRLYQLVADSASPAFPPLRAERADVGTIVAV
jgi:class 3 adenylate cyclase